ncbi:MAG: phosphoglycerate dehydrogenase [Actinomycetota bacterium]|nr:phosphoglycerate dehydrogenase [Actinomycetota bacterium]
MYGVKALLLENVHPDADAQLAAVGIEVARRPGALDEQELLDALPGVQLLGIRSGTRVTDAVIEGAPDLLAVGAFCIGTNQIDLSAATASAVAVFNAPFSNTRSVVELAVGEMISLTRRLTEKNDALHNGVWDKSAQGAHEMRGRTLGIIGYGNIGSQLSVLAEALGMGVVFFDTADKLPMGNARRLDSVDELLELADVVTLHVDGRIGNAGLFGAKQFAAMRPGAIFLNLSRGFVVDQESLADNIHSGHLAGAAIDVFPIEPKAQGDSFESLLRGLPNVILTPHVGGSTEEAQQDIGRFVSGKLRDYVTAGSTALSVNLPSAWLEARPGTHRLAHLHANTPGVVASVNAMLARHEANVEGQVLVTRDHLGYLLTDVSVDYAPEVVHALEAMAETVRLRVLS